MENAGQSPKKKPKILYIITKSVWGGAGRYVFDMATAFSSKYEVAVALGGEGLLSKRLNETGIRTINLPKLGRDVSLFKDISVFFDLVRIMREEKPDIVHLNSSKIGALGAVAGKVAGVRRVVFTGHGWAFNEDRPFIAKQIILFIHWLTILLCNKTIAVSEKTKADIAWLPFMKEKMVVVYNSIKPEPFYSKTEARRLLSAKHPGLTSFVASHKNALWIGSISELHKNKGLTHLIKAINKIDQNSVPSFVVVIMGSGEEQQALESLIKSLHLEQKIFLLGYTENAMHHLRALDIFTLTSITEAMPYVTIEVASSGTALLASAVGGIPEIVRQLESGILTKPGNTKEIAQGLTLLLNQPEKRALLGKNLHDTFTKNFSFEKMLADTEAVYRG